MIIGNGLLGTGFKHSRKNYDKYLIFVSGVSDSKETRPSEFDRERNLLLNSISANKDLKLIYVSTILIGTIDNEYYKHKAEMEEIIKSSCENYIIFRVPQIVGPIGNENNLLNHIISSIIDNKTITVFGNIQRALVHITDLINIIDYCLEKAYNTTIFLSHIEKIKVIKLCLLVKDVLKKDITLNVKNIENPEWGFKNSELVNSALKDLNINKKNYNKKTVKKIINENHNINICL